MGKETVMFIGAHPDDEIFGAGATLAKLKEKGSKVIVVILSYGELSGILAKKDYVIKTRVREDKKAQEMLGIDKSYYLGLREGHFLEEAEMRDVCERLASLIKDYKPTMIITHGSRDIHPDHRATFKITVESLEKSGVKTKLFTCQNIWGPESSKEKKLGKMFVDVSKEFQKKWQALKEFKSQKIAWFFLSWATYIRARVNGWRIRKKYAEVFYRMKME